MFKKRKLNDLKNGGELIRFSQEIVNALFAPEIFEKYFENGEMDLEKDRKAAMEVYQTISAISDSTYPDEKIKSTLTEANVSSELFAIMETRIINTKAIAGTNYFATVNENAISFLIKEGAAVKSVEFKGEEVVLDFKADMFGVPSFSGGAKYVLTVNKFTIMNALAYGDPSYFAMIQIYEGSKTYGPKATRLGKNRKRFNLAGDPYIAIMQVHV